jgi:predicted transcriptional regulator
MKNINDLLNEEIKANILSALLRNEHSFSELLKVSNLRDHGQLNYHLKLMINEGLIKKNIDKYTFTEFGERMGVYLNQIQFKEISPLSVVCALIINEKGEILLLK